ncbi:MAG: siderophore-interacting protein [Gammaproteobacteria bacterium]|jgi:NADPH-dependent ferric siderophore reductase
MAKASPWLLTVRRSERITPNMQRITFGGDGLIDFPQDTASAYLKVAFPLPKGSGAGIKRGIKKLLGRESVAVRSYTVRRYDPDTRELEIDFVVHGDAGPASTWAESAAVGDTLRAGGPGPKKLLNLSGEWFLIVGDMSALPAIGANLAHLPEDAKGVALIEILDAADRQPLEAPPGVEVRWIVNPDSARSADVVMEAIHTLEWADGQCEAWVAGELDTVRAVRSYLRRERGMSREHMYASSYWQHGLTDEQHRVEKAADQQTAAVG